MDYLANKDKLIQKLIQDKQASDSKKTDMRRQLKKFQHIIQT